jgi:hypothetical protein
VLLYRYLSRKLNMEGENEAQRLQADMAVSSRRLPLTPLQNSGSTGKRRILQGPSMLAGYP